MTKYLRYRRLVQKIYDLYGFDKKRIKKMLFTKDWIVIRLHAEREL